MLRYTVRSRFCLFRMLPALEGSATTSTVVSSRCRSSASKKLGPVPGEGTPMATGVKTPMASSNSLQRASSL